MYGQMTAGSWIYIGTQGILQGTYETFAAVAAQALRRHAGRHAHPHRRLRRHGRRAAAGRHHERRASCLIVDVDADPARTAGSSTATSTSAPTTSTTRSRACWRRKARAARAVGRPGRQRRRGLPRAAAPRRRRSTSSPTRPARTTRWRTCPIGVALEDWHDCADADPAEFTDAGAGVDGRARRGDGRLPGRRRRGLRLRQLDPRRGRSWAATTGPSTSPASCRPTSGRCSARARARSAGRRCPATRPTSPPPTAAILELFPDDEHLRRWITRGAGEGRLPGPAGPDLLARLRRARTWPGCGSTRWSPRASCRRPIVIGRDHLDSGSVASPVPRDRGDGRRLGRDRRLAAAQRAAQHRVRRDLGVDPPRRRRRHRPLDPRRPGHASPTAPTLAAQKLERVLTNDPGMGVMRHVDAGYERAARGRRASAASGSRCWTLTWTPRPAGRRSSRSDAPPAGGYPRLAWTRPTMDAAGVVRRRRRPRSAWSVTEDGNGNQWAWWGDRTRTRCCVGSHLDSVPDGGAARRAARRRVGARRGRPR